MKSYVLIPTLLLSGLLIAGCKAKMGESSSVSKSYHETVNGCDTGEHNFSSDSEGDTNSQYCAALKNDSLNNNCAQSQRYQLFKDNCPGKSWNP